MDNTGYYIDGIKYGETNSSQFTTSKTLSIFSYNHSHFFAGRLYKCTILSADSTVRNFIPCYNIKTISDVDGKECTAGTIGLYDTVEGKFYTNQETGTEDFKKGADVN